MYLTHYLHKRNLCFNNRFFSLIYEEKITILPDSVIFYDCRIVISLLFYKKKMHKKTLHVLKFENFWNYCNHFNF